MIDAYKIGGVTVTPGAGGYYTLTGKGIEGDGERVQGKEAADKRAGEIDKANGPADDDAHIEPQGDMVTSNLGGTGGETDTRNPAEKVQEAEHGIAPPTPPAPPAEPPVEDPAEAAKKQAAADDADQKIKDADARATAAEAANAALQQRVDDLTRAAQPIATVVADAAAPPPMVPHTIPQQFTGTLDKDAKKALKDAGLGYTRIVLEENESIPPTGLFVGHNGRSYMIKPGEEVDVPDFILGVLDDAKMSAPIMDSNTQKVLGYRDRSKYPYRVISEKG